MGQGKGYYASTLTCLSSHRPYDSNPNPNPDPNPGDVKRPTSGTTQRVHVKKAFAVAKIILKKGQVTHARRHKALKSHTQNASRSAKVRRGGKPNPNPVAVAPDLAAHITPTQP